MYFTYYKLSVFYITKQFSNIFKNILSKIVVMCNKKDITKHSTINLGGIEFDFLFIVVVFFSNTREKIQVGVFHNNIKSFSEFEINSE